MARILVKILLSALTIAGISELGRRYSLLAALLASLPLTSIMALTWLYWDTGDLQKVNALSSNILWAVIPSFLFFLTFPLLTKNGLRFYPAMAISCLTMFIGYTVYVMVLKKLNIDL